MDLYGRLCLQTEGLLRLWESYRAKGALGRTRVLAEHIGVCLPLFGVGAVARSTAEIVDTLRLLEKALSWIGCVASFFEEENEHGHNAAIWAGFIAPSDQFDHFVSVFDRLALALDSNAPSIDTELYHEAKVADYTHMEKQILRRIDTSASSADIVILKAALGQIREFLERHGASLEKRKDLNSSGHIPDGETQTKSYRSFWKRGATLDLKFFPLSSLANADAMQKRLGEQSSSNTPWRPMIETSFNSTPLIARPVALDYQGKDMSCVDRIDRILALNCMQMAQFSHPHIAPFHGLCKENTHAWLLWEAASLGGAEQEDPTTERMATLYNDLHTKSKGKSDLTLAKCILLCMGLVDAIDYLESKFFPPLCPAFFTSHHVLVAPNGALRLIPDRIEHTIRPSADVLADCNATAPWTAPEHRPTMRLSNSASSTDTHQGKEPDFDKTTGAGGSQSSCIYSMCAVLLEMLTLQAPPANPSVEYFLRLPERIPVDLRLLLKDGLSPQHHTRPSLQECRYVFMNLLHRIQQSSAVDIPPSHAPDPTPSPKEQKLTRLVTELAQKLEKERKKRTDVATKKSELEGKLKEITETLQSQMAESHRYRNDAVERSVQIIQLEKRLQDYLGQLCEMRSVVASSVVSSAAPSIAGYLSARSSVADMETQSIASTNASKNPRPSSPLRVASSPTFASPSATAKAATKEKEKEKVMLKVHASPNVHQSAHRTSPAKVATPASPSGSSRSVDRAKQPAKPVVGRPMSPSSGARPARGTRPSA